MDIQNIFRGKMLPLHFAVEEGNPILVQSIINAGYNVNIQDHEGKTALIIAVSYSNKVSIEIVKILLRADADILKMDNWNRSALEIVIDRNNHMKLDVVEIFLERVKYLCNNVVDMMEKILLFVKCPLENIVRMKNAELTKHILLKYNYNVNARNPFNGRTPLHAAVEQMDLENVRVLVDQGANVNALDKWDQVPLSFYSTAADDRENHLEIIRFLIKKGTLLNGPCLQGRSMPVTLLLIVGTQLVIQLLLQYISLSEQDHRLATPLHYLSLNENSFVAKELKNKTFNADALDRDGYTSLMYAASSCNRSTIKFLLNSGANVNYINGAITPILAPLALNYEWNIPRKTRAQYEACTEVFLRNGATLDIILPYPFPPPKEHSSFFDMGSRHIYHTIRRPILAHLAKLETRNQLIKHELREKVNSCPAWRRTYNLYRRELGDMKKVKIYRSFNMFTLVDDVEMKFIQRYHCHSKIVSKLSSINKDFPNSYLYRQLKKRIKNTIKVLKTRVIASACLSRIFNLSNSNHIVTQEIINYLTYRDHKKLVRLYSECQK